MSSSDTTARTKLPLPAVGKQLRDPRRILWRVDAHLENGTARLVAVHDTDVTTIATAERLADWTAARG